MPVLVTPEKKYAASYCAALLEGLENESVAAQLITLARDNFDLYMQKKNDMTKPVTLPDGRQIARMPQLDMWLVEGDMFLGRASIRPNLNDALLARGGHIGYAVRKNERRKGYGTLILKLSLSYLRTTFGHDRALVTCADDNVASAKIIEKCGGLLEDKVYIPGLALQERRYWIGLKNL